MCRSNLSLKSFAYTTSKETICFFHYAGSLGLFQGIKMIQWEEEKLQGGENLGLKNLLRDTIKKYLSYCYTFNLKAIQFSLERSCFLIKHMVYIGIYMYLNHCLGIKLVSSHNLDNLKSLKKGIFSKI